MEIILAEQLIYSAWNQFIRGALIPHSVLAERRNLGMYFHIRVDIENLGYEKDGHTYHKEWVRKYARNIHVIVTAGNRCYVAVNSEFRLQNVKPEEWKNTSNHNSCWHSDGLTVIRDTLMEGYEQCWDHVPKEHRETPAHCYKFCQFGVGLVYGDLFRFVEVTRRSIEDKAGRHDNYFDGLANVREVGFKVELEA